MLSPLSWPLLLIPKEDTAPSVRRRMLRGMVVALTAVLCKAILCCYVVQDYGVCCVLRTSFVDAAV
jgi:hypothetical protein